MRSMRTTNWVSLLDDVLNQLNNRQMTKLNGLSPNDFNSVFDDVKLQRSNEACEGQLNLEQPTVSTMEANQKDYEMSGNKFQLNSFVYVTKKKSNAFSKSFDVKASLKLWEQKVLTLIGSFLQFITNKDWWGMARSNLVWVCQNIEQHSIAIESFE